MSSDTRIYIVEDMPSMRERLVEFVLERGGVEVVGTAGRPRDAIDAILLIHPDLVLLDYQLDGGTGLDVLRGVHPQAPGVVFAILTHHATDQHRRACLEAGATAFFDKATDFAQLRAFIASFPRPHEALIEREVP